MKETGRLHKFASKLKNFWRTVGAWKKMGCGTFDAWDKFEVDLGQLELLTDQVERLRSKVRGFNITMGDIIAWKDLEGVHGIATGNLKKVKVDCGWVEVLRFFVVWSYLVAGIQEEDNVSKTWTPGAEDFLENCNKERKGDHR